MKFNQKFKQYAKLYMEGVIPQEHLPVHQGDQVVIRKDWKKDPQMQNLVNSSTGQRIDELVVQTDDPIIATSVSSKTPAAYGSFGSYRDNGNVSEADFMVTIGQQYAIGLYKNIVTVPMSILQRVENGINLPPLSKNQQDKPRAQTTGEKPEIDKTLSDPTVQTHASWKDNGINKI